MKKIALALLLLLSLSAHGQSQPFYIIGNGGTPTLGACGSGAALVAGSKDFAGTVTVGSGITPSCTVNWSETFALPPRCQATLGGVLLTYNQAPATTTGMTINTGISLFGATIQYQCFIQIPAQ